MTNALVPWSDQERMASAIVKSNLFGIKNTDQALALMAIAAAEGKHPGSVCKDYHIIQGRPALRADAMLARFQDAGGSVQWLEYTDDKVTGEFKHPKGGTLVLTWTLKQAKDIGLAEKDNWKNYPRAMLRARVISEGIRTIYPGVVTGQYTPEEVQDFAPSVHVEMPVIDGEIAEPGEGLALNVPDGDGGLRQYKWCADDAEWRDAYQDLVEKINSSKKMTDDEKEAKRHALAEVNSIGISRALIGDDEPEDLG